MYSLTIIICSLQPILAINRPLHPKKNHCTLLVQKYILCSVEIYVM